MSEDAAMLTRLRTGLEPFDMTTVEIGYPDDHGARNIYRKLKENN